ncbi:hypothetical protein AAHE18_05G105300 [Arachis hypogaea]
MADQWNGCAAKRRRPSRHVCDGKETGLSRRSQRRAAESSAATTAPSESTTSSGRPTATRTGPGLMAPSGLTTRGGARRNEQTQHTVCPRRRQQQTLPEEKSSAMGWWLGSLGIDFWAFGYERERGVGGSR